MATRSFSFAMVRFCSHTSLSICACFAPDWHTLLQPAATKPLMFANYSKLFFPHADEYVAYLADFARLHALNVRYDTRVTSITRPGQSAQPLAPFRLKTQRAGEEFECRYVIWAAGLEQAPLGVSGADLAVPYEQSSLDVDSFDNKTVLIIGAGNSAFETGDYIAGNAAFVHFISRERLRLAYEVHFQRRAKALSHSE